MISINCNWLCCGAKIGCGFGIAVSTARGSVMTRKKSSRSGDGGPVGDAQVRRVPMRDFGRSLPMSLLRAREAVMRQFRPSLRSHGLTEQQWRILRALTAVETIEVT